MATQRLLLEFLAPVPVGHRVALEYPEHRDGGLLGKKPRIDRRWFFVIDLDTGIRYGSQYAYANRDDLVPDPNARIAERYSGVVRACDVASHMGPDNQNLYTCLVVELTGHEMP